MNNLIKHSVHHVKLGIIHLTQELIVPIYHALLDCISMFLMVFLVVSHAQLTTFLTIIPVDVLPVQSIPGRLAPLGSHNALRVFKDTLRTVKLGSIVSLHHVLPINIALLTVPEATVRTVLQTPSVLITPPRLPPVCAISPPFLTIPLDSAPFAQSTLSVVSIIKVLASHVE
jgi:hypothetical protein